MSGASGGDPEVGRDACPACARWESAFHSVPDAIMILDDGYGIEWANRTMAAIVGSEPAALVGRRCYEVIHGTPAPIPNCPHALLIQDGREHHADVYEKRTRAHLRISVSPLRDAAGALTGAVHVARDVTELKVAAEVLRQGEDVARALVRLHEVSADHSLREVLDYALRELVRLTASELGYLYHYDERREVSDLFTLSHGVFDQCRLTDKRARTAFEASGLWRDAARERRVVVSNDCVMPDPRLGGLPTGQVLLTRHMSGPVIVNDRVVAVAGVGNKPTPYLAGDGLLLTNLTNGIWQVVLRKQHEEEILGYQSSLRWLHRRLATTEDEERRRLAAEIHDTISQDLAAIRLSLASLCTEEIGATRVSELRRVLAALEETIRTSRALSYKLSSPFLEQFGLAAALQWVAEDTGRQHGVSVECVCGEVPPDFPRDQAVLLHRIAQELLRNVVKHSGAERAALRLDREGRGLRLEIEDWGCGFRAPAPRSGSTEDGGFGLFSIRERLRDVGGSIRIRTAPGEGTHVLLSVPGTAAGAGQIP